MYIIFSNRRRRVRREKTTTHWCWRLLFSVGFLQSMTIYDRFFPVNCFSSHLLWVHFLLVFDARSFEWVSALWFFGCVLYPRPRLRILWHSHFGVRSLLYLAVCVFVCVHVQRKIETNFCQRPKNCLLPNRIEQSAQWTWKRHDEWVTKNERYTTISITWLC